MNTTSPDLAADFARLIADTREARALHRLRDTELPHLVGITDDERRALALAIDRRFCELNRAALGPQKSRW